jgi:hypothetical protein
MGAAGHLFGWLWNFLLMNKTCSKLFCVVRAHLTLRCVIFHPQRVGILEKPKLLIERMQALHFFEMPTLIFFLIGYLVGIANKNLKN